MAVTRRVAKPLCTAAEFALAEESFYPTVTKLNAGELRNRLQRARRLRDKYRDLAQKQAREIAGRQLQPRRRPITASRGTLVKRKLFEETFARFEKQLEKAVEKETRVARKKQEKRLLEKSKASKKAPRKSG